MDGFCLCAHAAPRLVDFTHQLVDEKGYVQLLKKPIKNLQSFKLSIPNCEDNIFCCPAISSKNYDNPHALNNRNQRSRSKVVISTWNNGYCYKNFVIINCVEDRQRWLSTASMSCTLLIASMTMAKFSLVLVCMNADSILVSMNLIKNIFGLVYKTLECFSIRLISLFNCWYRGWWRNACRKFHYNERRTARPTKTIGIRRRFTRSTLALLSCVWFLSAPLTHCSPAPTAQPTSTTRYFDTGTWSTGPTIGFQVSGADVNYKLGRKVASAGDVNKDGYSDILIGAPNADPFGRGAGSGIVYLLFGKLGGTAVDVDTATASFGGIEGIKIKGSAASNLGVALSGAGDVNGDGIDDFIVGAMFHAGLRSQGGLAVIIFGKRSGWDDIDMDEFSSNTLGFRVFGKTSYYLGESVSNAGDMNGDGYNDVIIGKISFLLNLFVLFYFFVF